MNKAIVRIPPDNNIVCIDYDIGFKMRYLQRDKDEVVSRALARIKLSYIKEKQSPKKKGKRNRQPPQQDSDVLQAFLLDGNGNRIDENITNGIAWSQAKQLIVGDKQYAIEVNPPKILSLRLPDTIMAQFPMVPILTAEFTDTIKYDWFTIAPDSNEETLVESKIVNHDSTQITAFIPQTQHVGSKLKVVCTPYNSQHTQGSDPSSVTVAAAITAGPGTCPCQMTHLYTKKRLTQPDSFRIVSYNVLADTYSSQEHTQKVLFPYCPPYALSIDYRKLLITRELYGYNADIICLQECDKDIFNQFYAPFMKGLGYDGIQDSKINNREGEATFYHMDRFNMIDHHCQSIGNTLKNDEIFEQICKCPTLKYRLLNRNSIVQIVTLQPKELENIRLVVVNTHFYFRPQASHIRILQGYSMLKCVEKYCEKFIGNDVRVLYCGDFNSHPRTALVKLMTTGSVQSNDPVWHEGGEEEFCENISLRNDKKCVSFTGYPQFTNFVNGFVECLDYIFGQPEHFQVEQVFPSMTEEVAAAYTALPSVVSPSDHVAIGCDLRLK
ncbi:uncharacterized protein TRIADDRAFT_20232 [Trichoplax adhaerens]|uniref:2',5'-phosphodiesterase 12 n=1 Tax=Trichoplax adhaerens TaxID=10228 RepID=B3RM93_TRIAD|nr:hypothetical protein TRIADDRAFT_20232 [Trichoplax adhaerens]EDV28922.1 hypothetical protein TRIADDRAFT_20232 [Trichoplax adhaerens]|eukprot:XP_002108124.1 hypothetical protein TRIADDRAFT_20232 [Trichoplax adhaerens]